MADTVRNRIIDAIVAAIVGLDEIGGLQDATEMPKETAAMFAANKCFVQLLATSETTVDRKGERSGMGLEHVEFDVEIVVHVPDGYESSDTPAGKAAKVNELLYGLYKSEPGDEGTWGNLAMLTKYEGGGGYSVSKLGTGILAVEHAFRVEYRFTIGDMQTAR